MKKNFYELSDKEYKKYIEEFKKTRTGKLTKIVNNLSFFSLGFMCFAFLADIVVSVIETSKFDFSMGLLIALTILAVFLILLNFFYEILFARWLKIKYKIEN